MLLPIVPQPATIEILAKAKSPRNNFRSRNEDMRAPFRKSRKVRFSERGRGRPEKSVRNFECPAPTAVQPSSFALFSRPCLTERRPPRSGLKRQLDFMRKNWRGTQNTGSSIFTATPILPRDRQRGPGPPADRQCLPNTGSKSSERCKNSRLTMVFIQEREFSSTASPKSLKFSIMLRQFSTEPFCSVAERKASSRQFRS